MKKLLILSLILSNINAYPLMSWDKLKEIALRSWNRSCFSTKQPYTLDVGPLALYGIHKKENNEDIKKIQDSLEAEKTIIDQIKRSYVQEETQIFNEFEKGYFRETAKIIEDDKLLFSREINENKRSNLKNSYKLAIELHQKAQSSSAQDLISGNRWVSPYGDHPVTFKKLQEHRAQQAVTQQLQQKAVEQQKLRKEQQEAAIHNFFLQFSN